MTPTNLAAVAADPESWPYRFEIIETNLLTVDHSYQRPLTSFVKRIAEAFDPALVGTLVTSQRSAHSYAVVDGQTRMEAAKIKGVAELPCLVYLGLSVEQEASLFARLQKERRGMASYHRFRASLIAKEDEAVQINRICESCGYHVGEGDGDVITAVAGLERVYRRDPALLERVLLILSAAWKGKFVPSGDMIRGVGAFVARTKDVDDERLALKLSASSPEEIKRRASALREGAGTGGGAEKYTAQAIEGIYRRKS